MTPVRILQSSLEDSPMTLVSWRLTSPRNSKAKYLPTSFLPDSIHCCRNTDDLISQVSRGAVPPWMQSLHYGCWQKYTENFSSHYSLHSWTWSLPSTQSIEQHSGRSWKVLESKVSYWTWLLTCTLQQQLECVGLVTSPYHSWLPYFRREEGMPPGSCPVL